MHAPLLSRSGVIASLVAFSVSNSLPLSQNSSAAADNSLVSLRSFDSDVRLFQADSQSLSAFYELPWSDVRRDRLDRFLTNQLQQLKTNDFEHLTLPGKIDFLLLQSKIQREHHQLQFERTQFEQMKGLLPGKDLVDALELKRWHLEPLDLPAIAQSISEIPAAAKHLREKLEAGRKKETKEPLIIPPVVALRAASALGQTRGLFQSWFKFYDGFQPDFSWWLQKPYHDAFASLGDLEQYLREEIAGVKGKDEDPLLGEPIGADMLQKELAAEWIPYSPQELIRIAEKEFAWCETQLKSAAHELNAGDDWKKALAKVKSDFVPPGAQKELVADQAHQAIDFIQQKDLVTIPPLCAETWRLSMISPEGQRNLPFAAYHSQHIMVAYASSEMSNEDKLMSMRGNNRHFTRIVTAHELIPGHHLQIFQAARHRPYRALFSTPFLVEGWALYWELRLWDLGYGKSPEDRIGMLFWRMHRAARIIVSLKFHLGEMRPEQMVDFLVDKVGHERSGAKSEVRRFISGAYGPLYQCAYMIGGLQLKALHDEAVLSHRMTEKEFHDSVLRQNAIPIELIRAGLLNLPLTKETAPSWKFYTGL